MIGGARALCAGMIAVLALASACSEVCDDGVDNDDNGLVDCDDAVCAFDAACDSCGDGVIDDDEACDSGDGCDDACALVACGNGLVDVGEDCDDGNVVRGDGCGDRCTADRCGDGTVQTALGEQCDDGNLVAHDGCSLRCQAELDVTCGNGQLDALEECEDGNGNDNDGCSAVCRFEFCGDGVLQPRLGERCETGTPNCVGCRLQLCGDGIRDGGEECDDGNDIPGDACTNCRAARCGNGFTELDEECDDANGTIDDGCRACTLERCGNGRVEGPEVCDGGDGCGATCLPAVTAGPRTLVTAAQFLGFGPQPFVAAAFGNDAVWLLLPDRVQAYADDGASLALVTDLFASARQVTAGALAAGRHYAMCFNESSAVVVPDRPVQLLDLGNCTRAAFADVNGDGRAEVVIDDAADGFRVVDPDGDRVGRIVSAEAVHGGARSFVVLHAPAGDRVAYLDVDGDLRVFDGATTTVGVAPGSGLLAADVDGDGADEVVGIDLTALVVDGVAIDVGFGVGNVSAGDVDGDAADDFVVVSNQRHGALLLSSAGHAPQPLAVPAGSRVAINDDGVIYAFTFSAQQGGRVVVYRPR